MAAFFPFFYCCMYLNTTICCVWKPIKRHPRHSLGAIGALINRISAGMRRTIPMYIQTFIRTESHF